METMPVDDKKKRCRHFWKWVTTQKKLVKADVDNDNVYRELFVEDFSQSEIKKQVVEENDDEIQIGEEEPDQSITVIPKSAYNISEEEAVEMIMPCAFEESDGEKYYEQELEYATMPITLEEKIEEMGEHVEEKIDAKMEEQVEKINEKMEDHENVKKKKS